MKFIHLTCDSRFGGINKFIKTLAESDCKDNNHFSFEAENLSPYVHQYNCVRFNFRRRKGILLIVDIFLNLPFVLYYAFSVDAIIMHSILLCPYSFLFFLIGKKFFFIVHDFNNPRPLIRLINYFFSGKVKFVSPILIASFSKKYYSRLNVLLPVTKAYIQSIDNKSKTNNSFQLDQRSLTFLYVGSLSYVKGLRLFLQNLVLLSSDLPIVIHVIGEIDKRYLQHFPDSSLLPSMVKVIYHGKIYDERMKSSIASKCNFSLIPSISEVFPYVYSESLMYGKIPLCSSITSFTSISSLRSHIFDTKSLVQIQNVLEWAASISTIDYLNYCKRLQYDYVSFCANYCSADSFADSIETR